jgi:branched-chain amino acid aminotransferase
MSNPAIWMNGRITALSDAHVSLFDHGLLYGDGVFEGIRFYDKRPFKLAAHLARLQRSATAIHLAIPYSADALSEAMRAVVSASDSPNGYVRLIVTRGEGDLGLDPRSCARPNVFLVAAPLRLFKESEQRGIDVIIASTRQPSPDMLDPRIKGLNYLNRILARLEAIHANASEALMLNAHGYVAEGTADNVFVAESGILRTPPATDGALEGITREVVLEIASDCGIDSHVESLAPFDLFTADEIFLSGTGAGLVPIRTIQGRATKQCPGPMFQAIEQAFNQRVRGEDQTT